MIGSARGSRARFAVVLGLLVALSTFNVALAQEENARVAEPLERVMGVLHETGRR